LDAGVQTGLRGNGAVALLRTDTKSRLSLAVDTLAIPNDPPYSIELVYNGLRLAPTLLVF
jgi:hypothetical protein